ncbi:MAG: hypothetical protein AB7O46_02215 [Xanthobacteraceae bacterium]|jgi:hypothetical protein
MKRIVMAGVVTGAFVAALGVVQLLSPVQAQTAQEIKQICTNKYSLGKYWVSASEERRKDFAVKYAACVRSKGKK